MPEELSSLRRSLRCDHERTDHEVDFLSLLVLFVFTHEKRLIHKVGQVCDSRDRVAVETVNNNFVDETAKWSTSSNALLL